MGPPTQLLARLRSCTLAAAPRLLRIGVPLPFAHTPQTLEADGSMRSYEFERGDALVFVSHKPHCVQVCIVRYASYLFNVHPHSVCVVPLLAFHF